MIRSSLNNAKEDIDWTSYEYKLEDIKDYKKEREVVATFDWMQFFPNSYPDDSPPLSHCKEMISLAKTGKLDHLGSGTFGRVYDAKDVVVKIFKTSKELGVLMENVNHEMTVCDLIIKSGLKSSKLTDVIMVDHTNKAIILRKSGMSLDKAHDMLNEHNVQFSLMQICKIGLDISQAVYDLNTIGMIYRDITTRNVLINDDVQLTDFGVCSLNPYQTGPAKHGTQTAAPENRYGFRSDVYSLGMMLLDLMNTPDLIMETANERSKILKIRYHEKLMNLIYEMTQDEPLKRLKISTVNKCFSLLMGGHKNTGFKELCGLSIK